MRVVCGEAERLVDARFELLGKRMLEPVCLLVDVVATGDPTNRITDGTHITVDGTRGIVSLGDNWSPTGVDEN